MSLSKHLQNSIFPYRKRKQISLDGTVAGLSRPGGHGRPVMADIGPWGAPVRDYVPPPAQSYNPHPRFAEFSDPEYDEYQPHQPMHHTMLHRDPAPSRPSVFDNPSGIPDYDALPMTPELFVQAMQEANSQDESPDPAPFNDVMANEIMHSQDSLEQLVAEPTPIDPIQEIEAAIDQQMQQMEEQMAPEPEPDPSPYVLSDDYMQMYDEQMMQFMDPFMMPGPGPMM